MFSLFASGFLHLGDKEKKISHYLSFVNVGSYAYLVIFKCYKLLVYETGCHLSIETNMLQNWLPFCLFVTGKELVLQ